MTLSGTELSLARLTVIGEFTISSWIADDADNDNDINLISR